MRKTLLSLFLLFTLIGCSTAPSTQLPANPSPELETIKVDISTPVHTQTVDPLETITDTFLTPEPGITPPAPLSWQQLPIVPEVSPEMIAVYQRGLALGRNPNRFSKIGDCQNITTYYLAMFDSGNYSLGPDYAYLQPTIDHFKGSWQRESLAVKGGMNVAAVQNVMWANPDQCKKGETPLQCELRVFNPSIAIISMEESWSGSISNYDLYLRKIVDYVLSQNIVPILATRAESPTQERQVNAVVAKIAEDYHIPLWNFGAATATLENYGISPDGFHLTGKNKEPKVRSFFDNPDNLKFGWTQRNLTALQSIDAVYRGLTGQ
jgi:hypothetical protein